LFDGGYSTADVPIRYADLHPDMDPLLTLLWMVRCNEIEIMEPLPTHARITPAQGLISLKTADPITAKLPRVKVLIMQDKKTQRPYLVVGGVAQRALRKNGFPYALFICALEVGDLAKPVPLQAIANEMHLARLLKTDAEKHYDNLKTTFKKNKCVSIPEALVVEKDNDIGWYCTLDIDYFTIGSQ